MQERLHELGFGWKRFNEQIQNHFYPVSLQKAKENEFMQLQQGGISLLEYASKFMERLKMNHFEVGLNPNIKDKMFVCQYTSYVDMYDTAVNVEKATKEGNNCFSEQHGTKRKGDR